MDPISSFIAAHLGASAIALFVAHHVLGIARDFLKKDSAAKLADNDPTNDRAARLEGAIGDGLDRLPDPLSILGKK